MVLEKTLERPLDCSDMKSVNPKGNQPWIFIGRTDAEAETAIVWPPHAKSWLIGKDPDAGKDWGQEEKGTTEEEMAGWHYQHNGYEFDWTPGDDDVQGVLACCSSWGCKELDTTEWMKWTELNLILIWGATLILRRAICKSFVRDSNVLLLSLVEILFKVWFVLYTFPDNWDLWAMLRW